MKDRIKPRRQPCDNAHLPRIFRMRGPYRNVVEVTPDELDRMAARRVRLLTTRLPVELDDNRDDDQDGWVA